MKKIPINRRKALGSISALAGAATLPQISFGRTAPAPLKKTDDFIYCLNMSTIRGQKQGFVKELELAAEAGYDAVEIWIPPLQEYVKGGGSLSDLKKRIDDLGITVEDAIGFAQWIVDDEATRKQALEQLKQEMDMLAQLGCPRIAAPPAGATNESGLDLRKAAERYNTILELGEQTGVMPQLEVWGFSQNLHLVGEVLFVAAESGHPKARILPDVYHIFKGGSDFNALKLISGPTIEVFHMNDYPASPAREQMADSDRVYPGDGIAPLPQILGDLKNAGGTKILSLELFNKSYWEQDALTVAKTGLQKMKDAVAMVN
jgi:2-keto-myo-inositol isomerase